MAVAILNYKEPGRHLSPIASLPLSNSLRFVGERLLPGDGRCLSDLTEDDHILMFVSSRALLANLRGIRCPVSLSLIEPPSIQGRYYKLLRLIGGRYHRIFTYSDQLLRSLPNARRCEHGCRTVCLPAVLPPKNRLVSLLASEKRTTPGHRMRHEIAAWSLRHEVGLELCGSGYGPRCLPNAALERYKFSVIIENSAYPGYFTEKLIDCLSCHTVPIYWGDPKIAATFDSQGMICCQDSRQLQQAIASCSDQLYDQMYERLQENVRRAERFATMPVIRAAEQLLQGQAALVANRWDKTIPEKVAS
jgi:Glycosyltransferase family 10 (fucosyltransferase) C-term